MKAITSRTIKDVTPGITRVDYLEWVDRLPIDLNATAPSYAEKIIKWVIGGVDVAFTKWIARIADKPRTNNTPPNEIVEKLWDFFHKKLVDLFA